MTGTEAEQERKRITGRAGIVALGTLTSRLLGLLRDMVLAAVFTRSATDAWLIAWQIPNLLRQLLAEGAMQTAVLPVLSTIRAQSGEEEALRFYRAMAGFMLCVLLLVSLMGVMFAPELVRLFASGFADQPGQLERTATLTRWAFPYIVMMGLAALGMAALNTHRRFVVTSFAPGLLNVAFLVAAFGLPGWLGANGQERILAMALGGLAGGVMQVVAQWPSLKRIGYLKGPTLPFSHPGVRTALARLAPSLLGIGVYGLDVLVGRRLLSELDQGAVTYFSYGLRLCDFSQGIFIMALSTATLPTLASFFGQGRPDEVSATLAHSLRLALFVGLAATMGSLLLAEPIVATVFERGHFDRTATEETSRAFFAQAIGIFLVAGVRQLVIVFFAIGKTMIPVYVAIADLVVFALLGYGLSQRVGHVGVGYAVTAARVTQFCLLALLLRPWLPEFRLVSLLPSFLRSLGASLGGAACTSLALYLLGSRPIADPWQPLLECAIGAIAFLSGFVACAALLKSEELREVVTPLRRRLRRSVD